MPTISPARTEIDALSTTTRPACVGCGDRPVIDPEDLLADVGRAIRKSVVERAPDHTADDAVLRGILPVHVDRLDRLAVADDRGRVCDVDDLAEFVADDDARDPLLAQVAQQAEQVRGVGVVQRRGRLVEDQQLDVLRQCLGDLDQLLLAHPELPHGRGRVLVEADPRHELHGAHVRLVPVDQAALEHLIAEEEVLGDREIRNEGELLVDDDDAGALGILDRAESLRLAVEEDLAVEGSVRVDARQHLHEGGFAGAVLAADRVDLAALDTQGYVLEHLDTGEVLDDVAHLEDRVRHRCSCRFCR